MHEGLANVCLISSSMTIVKSKIDMQVLSIKLGFCFSNVLCLPYIQIARKRKGFTQQHDKSLITFMNAICVAFLRHVNIEVSFWLIFI